METIISSEDAVTKSIQADGPPLVQMMRLAVSNSILANAVFSEWERNFLTDVAKRSREFGDKLTPKQAAKARQILSKPEVLTMLTSLYAGELATSPISEPEISPIRETPKVNYAADPEWGQF